MLAFFVGSFKIIMKCLLLIHKYSQTHIYTFANHMNEVVRSVCMLNTSNDGSRQKRRRRRRRRWTTTNEIKKEVRHGIDRMKCEEKKISWQIDWEYYGGLKYSNKFSARWIAFSLRRWLSLRWWTVIITSAYSSTPIHFSETHTVFSYLSFQSFTLASIK